MKTTQYLLLTLLSFSIISCYEQKTTILARQNGSGSIIITNYADTQRKGILLTKLLPNYSKIISKPPSASTLEDTISMMGKGYQLQSFLKGENARGWSGYRIVVQFNDINSLNMDHIVRILGYTQTLKRSGLYSNNLDLPSIFYANNVLSFKTPASLDSSFTFASSAESPFIKTFIQTLPLTKRFFRDLEIHLSIKIDGEIEKTNASYYNGDIITIARLDFNNLIKDQDALLKQLNRTTPILGRAGIQAITSGVRGIEFEVKKDVFVQFKNY